MENTSKSIEIIVHGRVDGQRELFRTENFPTIDESIIKDKKDVLSKRSAYSIALTEGKYILSKYDIIKDVLRNADGYIAFSILCLDGKLSGYDAKELLDQLTSKFITTYNEYYKPYEHKVKPDFKIEWKDLVSDLIIEYIDQLKENPYQGWEMMCQTDNAEDIADIAYIYYKSNEDLQKYIDEPYQEEYKKYRQIFLVDERYAPEKNKRKNDITEQIRLEDTIFKLHIQIENDVTIKIVDDNTGEHLDHGQIFKRSDIIKITYSKDYHKGDEFTLDLGKGDINNEYVDTDIKKRIVTIKTPDLNSETITVKLEIYDYNEKMVKVVNEKIILKGDDIGKAIGKKYYFKANILDIENNRKTEIHPIKIGNIILPLEKIYPPKPNKSKKWLIGIIIVVALIVALFFLKDLLPDIKNQNNATPENNNVEEIQQPDQSVQSDDEQTEPTQSDGEIK